MCIIFLFFQEILAPDADVDQIFAEGIEVLQEIVDGLHHDIWDSDQEMGSFEDTTSVTDSGFDPEEMDSEDAEEQEQQDQHNVSIVIL